MEHLQLGVATAKKWLTAITITFWLFSFILANVLDHGGLQFFCILITVFGFMGGIAYIFIAAMNIHGALEKIDEKRRGDRYVSEMTSGERKWAERIENFGAWLASRKKTKVQ